jgi:hypothetical protein
MPEVKQIIVQDLPATREVAENYINSRGVADRVHFEAHNFLNPQPRRGKYLFVAQNGIYIPFLFKPY